MASWLLCMTLLWHWPLSGQQFCQLARQPGRLAACEGLPHPPTFSLTHTHSLLSPASCVRRLADGSGPHSGPGPAAEPGIGPHPTPAESDSREPPNLCIFTSLPGGPDVRTH